MDKKGYGMIRIECLPSYRLTNNLRGDHRRKALEATNCLGHIQFVQVSHSHQMTEKKQF